MTAADLAPDPLASVANGFEVLDVVGYNNPVHGILVRDRRCGASSARGYVCTRPAGHPAHWRHVAANSRAVVDIWGGSVDGDPFAHVQAGQFAMDFPGWDDRGNGLRDPDRNFCRETKPDQGTGRFCTRPLGHPGKHVSTAGSYRHEILWTTDAPVEAPQVTEPVDPEDGSDVDPEDRVFTTAPEVGTVVKLRDRRNRLYVLGQRRHTPEVEVLDLLRNELRAIPHNRCVRVDDPLTPAELQQVTRWYGSHRDQVRRVAVREYRSGRWCMDGLNENLASMGMEPHQPVLSGQIQVTVPFECPDTHVNQSDIERRVTEALANPEVSAAMRVALPSIDGLELHPDAMTVRANNFHRG